MRAVLGFLLIGAAIIGGAWWLMELHGHISATLAGYTIEMATPLAIVSLAIIVLILTVLLKLVLSVFNLPARFTAWRARQRKAQGELAVTRGLVAIAAGNQAQARMHTARARKLLGDTSQTLLHAAEAARLAGYEDEAEALYRQLSEHKEAGFLGLRGLFRQAVARQDWDAAAKLGREAERIHAAPSWLRAERSEVAIRTGNWQQAIALAAPGDPTAAYAVAAVDAEPDASKAMRLAKRAVKDSPDFVPAILAYAKLLRGAGKESKAQSVLRDAWTRMPHPDIAAFALAVHQDAAALHREAAKLVQANPDHPESLFLRARHALAAGTAESITEARNFAEAAKAAGLNHQRLFRLFADIDAADMTGGTLLKPRETLRAASAADPDPAWRCDNCGAAQPSWMAVCPNCKTPGRISWGTGRKLLS